MDKHIVICGPGRSGTTFLWQLLRELGYDVGDHAEIFRHRKQQLINGRMKVPRVTKGTGGMSQDLIGYIARFNLNIEHMFVALRALDSIVASQAKMNKNKGVYKGLNERQLNQTLKKNIPFGVGKLILTLQELNIPYTTIQFPNSAQDSKYCLAKLRCGLPEIEEEKFLKAWNEVVKPNLIRNG